MWILYTLCLVKIRETKKVVFFFPKVQNTSVSVQLKEVHFLPVSQSLEFFSSTVSGRVSCFFETGEIS